MEFIRFVTNEIFFFLGMQVGFFLLVWDYYHGRNHCEESYTIWQQLSLQRNRVTIICFFLFCLGLCLFLWGFSLFVFVYSYVMDKDKKKAPELRQVLSFFHLLSVSCSQCLASFFFWVIRFLWYLRLSV